MARSNTDPRENARTFSRATILSIPDELEADDAAPRASLQELLRTGEQCDVRLAGRDGTTRLAHRSMLALASDYFQVLFRTDVGVFGNDAYIDASAPVLDLVLRHVYGQRITLSHTNVIETLAAAAQYLLSGLTDKCWQMLLQSLTIKNAVDIQLLSQQYVCEEHHRKRVRDYLTQHLYELSRIYPDALQRLDESFLLELLKSDNLNVTDELYAFNIAVTWSDDKLESHACQFLIQAIATLRNIPGKPLHLLALSCHSTITQRHNLRTYIENHVSSAFMCSRAPRDILFAFGGTKAQVQSSSMEVFDPNAAMWLSCVKPMPRAISGFATVVLKNRVYVLGGRDHLNVYNSVFVFNPRTGNWTRLSNMKVERAHGAAVVVSNTCIYAIGGQRQTDQWTTSMEHYSKEKKTWELLLTSMPTVRKHLRACYYKRLIYIFGADTALDQSSYIEAFNPSTMQWSFIQSLPRPSRMLQVVRFKSVIYIFEAVSEYMNNNIIQGSNVLLKFHPRDNLWERMAPLPSRRAEFEAVVFQDRIFAVGGSDGATDLATVEVYDPFTDTWNDEPPMRTARTLFGLVALRKFPGIKQYSYCEFSKKLRGTNVEAKVTDQ